jgi:galactonate dehydratase
MIALQRGVGIMTRRELLRSAVGLPVGAALAQYEGLAAPAQGQIKITDIQAMQVRDGGTLIRVKTDAGITGIGPCGASGPVARDTIRMLHQARLPHLGLIGKDPLAIRVHFHNMFYGYPQRARQMKVLSGIDIALWDLAGKVLNKPVSKLLGGNFREEIPLYSHCSGSAEFLKKENWKRIVDSWTQDARGFRAFKIDIHTAFGGNMQQTVTSLGPREIRVIAQAYANAREAFGTEWEMIVHCHCELDAPTAVQVAEAIEPIKPLYFEDPLTERYSESWLALRRSTRVPLSTGENLELLEGALPFLQGQVVEMLQPDLINSGGITGVKIMADMAAHYRVPICLHNVSGHVLNMASQQFSAAQFNCPWMECQRNADQTKLAASNAPVIQNGRMKVSTLPGLGLDLNEEYLKANLVAGESWWG